MKPIEILDIFKEIEIKIPQRFVQQHYKEWFQPFKETLALKLSQNITLCSGASKAVIVFEKEDFIIKIPFNGEILSEYGEYYFNEFEGAAPALSAWDYCDAETSIYEKAELEGVEEPFAAEYLIGFLGGYPVYAQERAIPFEETEVPGDRAPSERFPSYWIKNFVEEYGENRFQKFDDFCEKYNLYNDMHEANFGYSWLDNRPVLIDYSNFEG